MKAALLSGVGLALFAVPGLADFHPICIKQGDICFEDQFAQGQRACECGRGGLLQCKGMGDYPWIGYNWVLVRDCPMPPDGGLQCVDGACNEAAPPIDISTNGPPQTFTPVSSQQPSSTAAPPPPPPPTTSSKPTAFFTVSLPPPVTVTRQPSFITLTEKPITNTVFNDIDVGFLNNGTIDDGVDIHPNGTEESKPEKSDDPGMPGKNDKAVITVKKLPANAFQVTAENAPGKDIWLIKDPQDWAVAVTFDRNDFALEKGESKTVSYQVIGGSGTDWESRVTAKDFSKSRSA